MVVMVRNGKKQAEKADGHKQRRIQQIILFGSLGLIIGVLTIIAAIGQPESPPSDAVDNRKLQIDPAFDIETSSANLTNTANLPLGEPEWHSIDTPEKDGWKSERFAQHASKQLDQLTSLLLNKKAISANGLSELVDVRFSCSALWPSNVHTVFEDQTFTVRRSDRPLTTHQVDSAELTFRGVVGCMQAVKDMLRPFRNASDVHFKFKILDVQLSPQEARTRQLFSIAGRNLDGMVELNATLDSKWSNSPSQLPRMRWLGTNQFEITYTRSKQGPLFSDRAMNIIGNNDCYRKQFLYNFNYWLSRSQDSRHTPILGNPGLAIGDINGDGLDDLYVCQERGLPNRLFVHSSDGTAVEKGRKYGVDWLDNSRSALLIDLDNDGDQDLAVSVVGGVALAANDSQGRFHLRTVLDTNDDVMSLSSVDYNDDGLLDLYVCVYQPDAKPIDSRGNAITSAADSVVLYDSNTGGQNSLFRNESKDSGNWQFSDVTAAVGLDVNNQRHSFAAAWEDFDNDRDQDLYVANDFGTNNLYRNDGGRFTDVTADAGVLDQSFGMSVAWSDYDRDGWMDIYVSNMFSAAGHRVTGQTRFKPDASAAIIDRFRYLARGNSLFRNNGNGSFDDVSAEAGVTMGRWAWSSNFADINNDGWEDLVVTNGYITAEDSGDL